MTSAAATVDISVIFTLETHDCDGSDTTCTLAITERTMMLGVAKNVQETDTQSKTIVQKPMR